MTTEARPVDPETFRRAVARWATGVSIVTAREGAARAGMTVNALLSVSLEPPTLLVSLTSAADTTPVVERTGRFAVSLLSADHQAVSERFAKTIPSEEKFGGLRFHDGPDGLPYLTGSLASFACRLERSVPVYDHHLLVGRVYAVELGPEALPLTFFRSRYGEPAGPGAVRLAPTHE